MITYLPAIIMLGLIMGMAFGRYYMSFYKAIYEYFYHRLVKVSDTIAVIGGFLFGLSITFIFAIWGLVFSPLIPDNLWVYLSKSYFIGILIGMIILRISNHKKKNHHSY